MLDPVRALLAVSLTLALSPFWPNLAGVPSPSSFLAYVATDASFGLLCGLWVLTLAEGFTMAAQVFSLQAGYAYASTIDPSSDADSGVLAVIAQLAAGLFFFTTGLHRWVVAALARSPEVWPPGQMPVTLSIEATVVRFGNVFFEVAVRLALPVVALLLMADLTLALLGRLNAQMQLISMAFPVKMLATLLILAATASFWPGVYEFSARQLDGWLPLPAVTAGIR